MSYIIGVQDVRKLRVSLDSVEPDHVTKYLFPCLKLKQECWIDHISGVALAGIVSKEQLSFLAVTSDVNVEYAFKTIKTWQHYGVPFDILKEVLHNNNLLSQHHLNVSFLYVTDILPPT
jgi:hypothetical protein